MLTPVLPLSLLLLLVLLVCCVQVVGALHHGKTTLMDMLVEQTHDVASLGIRTKGGKPLRFTDTRIDEQVAGVGVHICESAAQNRFVGMPVCPAWAAHGGGVAF